MTRGTRRDRRRVSRFPGRSWPLRGQLHIRPGHAAEIVNWSAWGALVESDLCLTPGSHITLLAGDTRSIRIRGRVVRCSVAALRRNGTISYRGALFFGQEIDFGQLTKNRDDHATRSIGA